MMRVKGVGAPVRTGTVKELGGQNMTDYPEGTTAPTEAFAAHAHVNKAQYDAMYKASIDDPDTFWGEHGKNRER